MIYVHIRYLTFMQSVILLPIYGHKMTESTSTAQIAYTKFNKVCSVDQTLNKNKYLKMHYVNLKYSISCILMLVILCSCFYIFDTGFILLMKGKRHIFNPLETKGIDCFETHTKLNVLIMKLTTA